jgi:hypothetical protein
MNFNDNSGALRERARSFGQTNERKLCYFCLVESLE